MKQIARIAVGLMALTLVSSLAGCSGMSKQNRNTAIGAGVGGVAGSVLTDGSVLGTVGGAAVGGFIGHEATKD